MQVPNRISTPRRMQGQGEAQIVGPKLLVAGRLRMGALK